MSTPRGGGLHRFVSFLLAASALSHSPQLVAEYLAQHAPSNFRWAIAGRSKDRLEAVLRSLPPSSADIVLADLENVPSLVCAPALAITSQPMFHIRPSAPLSRPLGDVALKRRRTRRFRWCCCVCESARIAICFLLHLFLTPSPAVR